MPDSLVKKNARPAGAEDDGHLAGRSIDCAELQDCCACGLAGVMLRGFVCFSAATSVFEEGHGDAATAAAAAACGVRAVFCDDEDVEARERLGVAGEGSVGGSDEDAAEFIVEACANLGDAGVIGSSGLV